MGRDEPTTTQHQVEFENCFFIIYKLVFETYSQWSNWEGNTDGWNHSIFLNLHFLYPRKTYAQYIS